MNLNSSVREFHSALHTRNYEEIMKHLNEGNNINMDCGFRAFDVLLSMGGLEAAQGLSVVLKSPRWNPNYRSADSWHPEERAMIHQRQELAIQILKHPNFDKTQYPRVVQSATRFKADKVLEFLSGRTRG